MMATLIGGAYFMMMMRKLNANEIQKGRLKQFQTAFLFNMFIR